MKTRRDFLKDIGIVVAGLALNSCRDKEDSAPLKFPNIWQVESTVPLYEFTIRRGDSWSLYRSEGFVRNNGQAQFRYLGVNEPYSRPVPHPERTFLEIDPQKSLEALNNNGEIIQPHNGDIYESIDKKFFHPGRKLVLPADFYKSHYGDRIGKATEEEITKWKIKEIGKLTVNTQPIDFDYITRISNNTPGSYPGLWKDTRNNREFMLRSLRTGNDIITPLDGLEYQIKILEK